jgi:hypothetical protein
LLFVVQSFLFKEINTQIILSFFNQIKINQNQIIMKKLFKSIVVVAVVLISSGIFAQAKRASALNENSLLWKFQERD